MSGTPRPEVDSLALIEIDRRLSVASAPDFSTGNCRDTKVLMQPHTAGEVRAAKAVCEGCPCLEACGEWAMTQPAWLEGVFGGMAQVDRERERAARRKAAGTTGTKRAVAA